LTKEKLKYSSVFLTAVTSRDNDIRAWSIYVRRILHTFSWLRETTGCHS